MLRRHSLGQKNLTASGQWGSLPGDTKDVMGVGFLATGCRVRFAGYLNDQLFRLNLNACNPGSNEATVATPRIAATPLVARSVGREPGCTDALSAPSG
jgi:hypothetical protein